MRNISQVLSYKVEKLVFICYYLELDHLATALWKLTSNQLNAHLIFPNDHQCVFWITEENNHKVNALPTFTENTLRAHKLRLTHAYIHLLTYSSSSVSPIGLHIPEWHVLSIWVYVSISISLATERLPDMGYTFINCAKGMDL